MAYTASTTLTQVGPNDFELEVTETAGPEPSAADEHVLFTVPGARPGQPVELLTVRTWFATAGAASTVNPKIRRSDSTLTDDGSVEWEATNTAAIVNEEPRAIIAADGNGQLRLYTTPDVNPGATGDVRSIVRFRLQWGEHPR